MKQTAAVALLLPGLCFLPACFPQNYMVFENPLTWNEARSYCTSKNTELAVVHNEKDLARLNEVAGADDFWIGLSADVNSWRWSLEDPEYYGEGEAEFRLWKAGDPNGQSVPKVCAAMDSDGTWVDMYCSDKRDFICYNKSTEGTPETSPSFIYVKAEMTWDEARAYCREKYTDLASVRNQAENDQIKNMTSFTWIGLYRNSWRWSDGSEHSIQNWSPGAPTATDRRTCVFTQNGKWVNSDCSNKRGFVCYSAFRAPVRKVVKVVVKRAGTPVDIEELDEEIIEKIYQRLKEQGLSGDIKLTWRKQPDGTIFRKKEEEAATERTDESCPFTQF